MKHSIIKLALLSLYTWTTTANAQQIKGNSILYTSTEGNLRIEMCSETMFRITKVSGKTMPDNEQWMVVNYNFPQVKIGRAHV